MPKGKPNRKPSAKDSLRLNGAAVRVIRDQLRGLSQDGLAQAAGLNPSTVSRYENGTGFASLEAMYRIAAALKVDVAAITYPVHTVHVPVEQDPAA